MTQVRLQDVVHQCLESHWSIGEAEWHNQELEVSMVGSERRLLHVLRHHDSCWQVELGEELGATERSSRSSSTR